MEQAYRKTIGRVGLDAIPDHQGSCTLTIMSSFNLENEDTQVLNSLSIEELHDLKYLIERALETLGK